jgi:hypothetical protein
VKVCGLAGIEPGAIDAVFHGTTVATNMAIELVGAEVGTITTRGFRDILHMARHRRPHNFSLQFDVPWQSKPLIKRCNRCPSPRVSCRRPAKSPFRSPWTKSGRPPSFRQARHAGHRGVPVFLPQQRARAARKEIVISVLPNMSVSPARL